MKLFSFKQYVNSQSLVLEEKTGVLKHLTHLEELILTNKKEGLATSIRFLNELFDSFNGNTKSGTFVSIKIDGAPAAIVGINPENNKFFVSTKSLGNVVPKINYTEADVDANHGHAPGLAQKLKLALKYLPRVVKSGVYQGDFLYDQQDLKIQMVDGEKLVTFKPNTIVYAVPQNSALGQRIMLSKMGIVFHTKYNGASLSTLQKSADVNASEFGESPDVFVDDAKFKDMSGFVTFTKEESAKVQAMIKECQSVGNTLAWNEISEVTYQLMNVFVNSLIRDGRFVESPRKDYDVFAQWVKTRYQKDIDKMKTEKGKAQKQEALVQYIDQLASQKLDIIKLFELTQKLASVKKMFIDKYNKAIKTKQFLLQPDGTLQVTDPEGYVAVDRIGNMVKFVDRLGFSRANFMLSKSDKFK